MKLGFLTACLPNVQLTELAKWAAENKFQSLELAAWPQTSQRDYQAGQVDVVKLNREAADRIKELFLQYKLQISALAYYDNNLHPDLQVRGSFHQHLKKVIEAAALLDVQLVGTFVGSRPDKTPSENIREIGVVFRELVKFAEDRGIKLMIENCPMENWIQFGLPGNFAYSPELWTALFSEVPSENFGLNFDPSHLYWLGIDYLQAAAAFAHKIFHAHAKDTEMLPEGKNRYGIFSRQIDPIPWKSGWWRYRMPGLGEIDWQKFIAVLQENGYDFVVSIEHEDPVWEGSDDKVKRGLLLAQKHLSQFLV